MDYINEGDPIVLLVHIYNAAICGAQGPAAVSSYKNSSTLAAAAAIGDARLSETSCNAILLRRVRKLIALCGAQEYNILPTSKERGP